MHSKSPEELIQIQQQVMIGARDALRHFDSLGQPTRGMNALRGLQRDLYFIGQLQLRWGINGFVSTLDELDSLLPVFHQIFQDKQWQVDDFSLGAHIYLSYLVGRQVPDAYFARWEQGVAPDIEWTRTHLCDAALCRVLRTGKPEKMPCQFGSSKRLTLHIATYENYFSLVRHIHDGSFEKAAECVAVGEQNYKKRGKNAYYSGGASFEGGGPDNDYMFDFRLAALVEHARRIAGWELPVSEVLQGVLKNAARIREGGS